MRIAQNLGFHSAVHPRVRDPGLKPSTLLHFHQILVLDFQHFYNGYRAHAALKGELPQPAADGPTSPIDLASHRWQKHCRGLYETPIAA
jgi:hypothetical protein